MRFCYCYFCLLKIAGIFSDEFFHFTLSCYTYIPGIDMILAFDTYYYYDKAKTVCLAFKDWQTDSAFDIYAEVKTGIEQYIPGEFYKRELPCIISVLKNFDLKDVECIIVDGYVYLDDNLRPGLGAHLYEALDKRVPVIGVAKTNFATLNTNKSCLLRGKSVRPLFITSAGVDLNKATMLIKNMTGENRIPTLLKKLDAFTKELTTIN